MIVQNDPVEEELASQAAALLKRSKSHHFYGLMGKRSGKNLCLIFDEKYWCRKCETMQSIPFFHILAFVRYEGIVRYVRH